MEQPKDLSKKEWEAIREFAFQYAKQQGFYDDVNNVADIDKSRTYGESAFETGLNTAVVSCRYWRTFYKKQF